MAFDSTTRNRLAHFVADARGLIAEEFTQHFQSLYGISPKGECTPLEKLPHLDEMQLATAALLRERIQYLIKSHPDDKGGSQAAVERLAREQAFTVLNRFAAIRMAEKRGIIVESIGKSYQSKGFKVYETVAGSGLGEAYHRYQRYLLCLFDELAVDLGVLFDRRSPHALLFPREQALLALLELINAPEIEPLWAEDETIGWIYQYYNDPLERKKMREESSAPRNSRELAVRNQFFTPRYVVEFLTDNTLGRIWYEMTQGDTTLKEQCRYLVRRPTEIFLAAGETPPAENQEQSTKNEELCQEDLLKQAVHIPHRPLKDPRTILMLDPACGSMHFGLYAFDLFEVIYREAWELEQKFGPDALIRPKGMKSLHSSFAYRESFMREVPKLIIECNIHGIDIDPRAAQIAGLALWLRAQKAWQRLGLLPAQRPVIKRSNVVCAEPMPGEKELLREFVEQTFPLEERPIFEHLLNAVFDKMQLAGEAGSLLKIEEEIQTAIAEARTRWKAGPQLTQGLLFGGTGSTEAQDELDLSGVTDALFWERIEERIYAALRDYAEQAENGGGFQRRLFAEDAARGFAFIDVCRKRYDVALMNPPFGEFSIVWRDGAKLTYPSSFSDILAAFVERGGVMLTANGRLGAITSRAVFFIPTMTAWRENVIAKRFQMAMMADLGEGVMDGAAVEAAAYVLQPGIITPTVCIRALTASDRSEVIQDSINNFNAAKASNCIYSFNIRDVLRLPQSPFAYWVSSAVIQKLLAFKPFEPQFGAVRVGLQTGDDFRFARLHWEVLPRDIRQGDGLNRDFTWAYYVKSDESYPWFTPIHLTVNWQNSGNEIRNFKDKNGKLRSRPQNVEFYFRPGFSWAFRSVRFTPSAIPSGCVPDVCRYMGYPVQGMELSVTGLLASNTASSFLRFYGRKFHWPVFLVSSVKSFPCSIDPAAEVVLRKEVETSVASARLMHGCSEESIDFLSVKDHYGSIGTRSITHIKQLLSEEGEACIRRSYGLSAGEHAQLCADLNEAVSGNVSALDADADSDAMCAVSSAKPAAEKDDSAGRVFSYAVGVTLGRWDIRYATGEQAAPELPDPFAPLPVCPPGQLQNAQGLPARPEDVPAAYPVRIPWDGILVDDPNHPLDIERRVREVIEIIWSGKEGGPTAEAIEHEACEILGVKSLRDYFRKPAGFFADHLKRYSKSRRQAPIYWPLSTASGSYTLWIYYHRLTDQTLHTVLADFLEPKIRNVQAELDAHQAGGNGQKAGESRDFLDELKDLRDEIERIIKLPWKPNLNDGVLITASPLWKLFRLTKWQKDLKAYWDKLEDGEYDWAHLAFTIWPRRVEKLCVTDRSVAIAHSMEHLCKVEPPKPKKRQAKTTAKGSLNQDVAEALVETDLLK